MLELEAVRDASASSGAPVADGNSANGHQEVGGSQQGVANGAAVSGKDIGSLPMVRCELPDVNALLTHLEKVAPAWRGCVAEACRCGLCGAHCSSICLTRCLLQRRLPPRWLPVPGWGLQVHLDGRPAAACSKAGLKSGALWWAR